MTKDDDRKVIPIRPGISIGSKTDHLDVVMRLLSSASPEQNTESNMSVVMTKIDGLLERIEALETYVYRSVKKTLCVFISVRDFLLITYLINKF